ncbi:MAG TPA: histidine kinase [Candidatus Aminicenantes bacterium]|nr:histidine kinase [Candidatus Aminicenantes bacterium]
MIQRSVEIQIPEAIYDRELLRRIAEKDHRAFKILVDRFQNKVLNLCFRLLDNPQNAEDVAQEVFFQVYKSSGKFRHDCLVSTWIYRIILNRCRNFNRDNRKFRWWGGLRREFQDVRRDDPVLTAAKADDPESAWNEHQTKELIWKAIASLPEKQKTMLILHKFEGHSYKEIAEVLDVSLPSVESCLHRAKINLQKKLAPYFLKGCRDRKF